MKRQLLIFACIILSAASQLTAQAVLANDVYRLGSRTVHIPAPEGFFDTFPHFDRVTGYFIAAETPSNNTLAAYVPNDTLPQLKAGIASPLIAYAKISVSREAITLDATPQLFANVVSDLEKRYAAPIAADSTITPPVAENAAKWLAANSSKDSTPELKTAINLGHFQKTDNVFSAMMIMKLEAFSDPRPYLASVSLLNVNNRLIYVYAYRQITSDKDADVLSELTKTWTAAIVAANR